MSTAQVVTWRKLGKLFFANSRPRSLSEIEGRSFRDIDLIWVRVLRRAPRIDGGSQHLWNVFSQAGCDPLFCRSKLPYVAHRGPGRVFWAATQAERALSYSAPAMDVHRICHLRVCSAIS